MLNGEDIQLLQESTPDVIIGSVLVSTQGKVADASSTGSPSLVSGEGTPSYNARNALFGNLGIGG